MQNKTLLLMAMLADAAGNVIEKCTGDELDKILKGEVADVADDALKNVKESKILTTSEAEEYAFNAIRGSDKADIVVLGKYDSVKNDTGEAILDAYGKTIPSDKSYNVIAENMNTQYFELDNWDDLTKVYSDEEIWKINERFLDIQTSSGRDIYLANDPSKYLGENTYFAKELQYLQENGYTFVKEGEYWHAVR